MSDIQTEQDAYWAGLRRAGRFNISRRFPYAGIREGDPLAGRASRFAYTVVDSDTDTEFSSDEGWELVLRQTPTRQQLKVLFFEDSRQIMQVAFQRFRNGVRIERECFTLRDEEITQMFGFFELLQSRGLLIEEDGEGFRFSPELARQVLEDGAALSNFARTHPEVLQTIIQSEISAPDVIALAHRKNVLEQFDQLLHDESAFKIAEQATGGPENTWQSFFEDNPWIVGGTLAPQFLHSFDPNRLEQTVRGFSIASGGRRADAVLRTAGAISAIVLVEIKHHKTSLLAASPYRSDYWNVGKDVIGGVAQCQATVDAAEREFGSHLEMTDELGGIIDEVAVCRPRSLLVVGSLSEFHENDRFNRAKYESFERFRRSLRDPEIVTFDELFERARIMLELSIEGPGEEA